MAEAKPFSDEDVAIKQKLAVHCKIEKCNECRWVATITADRKVIKHWQNRFDKAEKRIEELEQIKESDTAIKKDHRVKMKAQTATIERLRGEKKERDDFLNKIVQRDIDLQLKKTIKNFYRRQRQALDAGKE